VSVKGAGAAFAGAAVVGGVSTAKAEPADAATPPKARHPPNKTAAVRRLNISDSLVVVG
jgi:hypothetical protein